MLEWIEHLQNKALRLISKISIRDSISPQYYKLNVLKFNDRFVFEIAKNLHQFTLTETPSNFDTHFSDTTNVSFRVKCQISNNIFSPRFRNLQCHRSKHRTKTME